MHGGGGFSPARTCGITLVEEPGALLELPAQPATKIATRHAASLNAGEKFMGWCLAFSSNATECSLLCYKQAYGYQLWIKFS